MTVPGRVDAAAILLDFRPPTWFERHSRAVAEVAAWLAGAVERRGGRSRARLDRRAVEAGALLHDIDKVLPRDDPARALGHGFGSADWLARRGHGELAPIVAAHPVTRLADAAWFEAFMAIGTLEQWIVAYADKRARQRVVTLEERFAEWDGRYGGGRGSLDGEAVRRRAATLEARVCDAAGVRPADVRRLAWTAAALRRAAGAAS